MGGANKNQTKICIICKGHTHTKSADARHYIACGVCLVSHTQHFCCVQVRAPTPPNRIYIMRTPLGLTLGSPVSFGGRQPRANSGQDVHKPRKKNTSLGALLLVRIPKHLAVHTEIGSPTFLPAAESLNFPFEAVSPCRTPVVSHPSTVCVR